MAAAAVGVASRARRSSGPRGVAFCRWTNGLLHPRFVFPEAAAVAGSWAGSAQGKDCKEKHPNVKQVSCGAFGLLCCVNCYNVCSDLVDLVVTSASPCLMLFWHLTNALLTHVVY
uniref:Uncharacterized protein n=1 Tax=Oryza barthii TaxID=65489 RepID=A0A0D3ELD6_9ORYZ